MTRNVHARPSVVFPWAVVIGGGSSAKLATQKNAPSAKRAAQKNSPSAKREGL